jgi:hypothetical protein
MRWAADGLATFEGDGAGQRVKSTGLKTGHYIRSEENPHPEKRRVVGALFRTADMLSLLVDSLFAFIRLNFADPFGLPGWRQRTSVCLPLLLERLHSRVAFDSRSS